ncbi:MAG: hypothetical protein ACOC3V_00270 [bacterium]
MKKLNSVPTDYSKKQLITFLEKNNENINLINRLKNLPEKIKYNNVEYTLNILISWYNINNTYYEFELNYYSEKYMEFLFSYKILKNIEESIKFLENELKKKKNIQIIQN